MTNSAAASSRTWSPDAASLRRVAALLAGFDAGFARGLSAPIRPHLLPADPPPPLLRFAQPPAGAALLAGRPHQGRELESAARDLRAQGQVVTVARFSRTALFHHSRFRDDGIWDYRGGIYGRASRDQPLLQRGTFAGRVGELRRRIAPLRQNSDAADATA